MHRNTHINRLDPLQPTELSPEQQALADQINNGPRGNNRGDIATVGPFGVWLRAPAIGQAAQALGSAVRFNSSLPENVKEVAICTVGAHYQAKFEFAAHGALARRADVAPEVVEALRVNGNPSFSDAGEALAWKVTRALLIEHRIEQPLYDTASEHFGEQALVELVTTIGYYCAISLTLNAFDVQLAEGMQDPFPSQE